MRKFQSCGFALIALSVFLVLVPAPAFADCGDGIVESNESCDPGIAEHPLHEFGDPDLAACPGGGGANCFFSLSCCKWNCQDVGDSDVVCNKDNPCQPVFCDQNSLCTIPDDQPATTPCDDGLYCNGADECDGSGGCTIHAGSPCSETECNSCQEGSQSCLDPVGTACVGQDPGACQAGTCDGAGACTLSAADDGTACDDGVFCNGSDTCLGGECVEHAGDPCSGSECNTCQEDVDSCLDPPGTACSDEGNVCTDDACDGEGSCQHLANTQPCDDGLFCNGLDQCSGGTCSPLGLDPCDDEVSCTDDACDEEIDSCSNIANAGNCDDGQFCNGVEVCDVVTGCGGGADPCVDGNLCTEDACDEGSDSCSFDPIPEFGACDDTNLCTLDDECIAGECVGTTPLMGDLCPWTLLTNDTNPKSKDKLRVGARSAVVGDFCGGLIIVGDNGVHDSTLASPKSEGKSAMRIGEDVQILDDIVSAGAGIKGKPASVPLPTLDVGRLAPGSVTPKGDATGTYDFSGTHPLASDCLAARAAFDASATAFSALAADDSFGELRLKGEQVFNLASVNVGGTNVFDFEKITLGRDIILDLDGGGDPATVVVIRVAKALKAAGRGAIQLSGGLTPQNVIVYVRGKKCEFGDKYTGGGTLMCEGKVKIGNKFNWNGVVLAGSKKLQIGEESTVTFNPFQAF